MNFIKKNKEREPAEHVHGPDCDHEHHHKSEPNVNEGPKLGRNEPCSCGSQKKFKKCCGK